jgi:hypothetical protein
MERALLELIWRRAEGRCEYCQTSQTHDRLPFEIDHIVARKHGGLTRPGNLCLACFACNNHKGSNISGVDGKSGAIVPLFNPRRHRWRRHFRWAGPVLVGRTSTGRATAAVLAINLEHRVNYRQALVDEGVFPPTRES